MITSPPIILIAAVSRNGVIGDGSQMPWHLPEDLKHFKKTTSGRVVIMGRKTFDSLGQRPLPGRVNIVVSSRPPEIETHPDMLVCRDQRYTDETPLVWATSVDTALRYATSFGFARFIPEIYIIGGGEIYSQSISRADRLIISHVDVEVEGSVRFPEIDSRVFSLGLQQPYENSTIPFVVTTYHRRK